MTALYRDIPIETLVSDHPIPSCSVLTGHGMDRVLTLIPIYKYHGTELSYPVLARTVLKLPITPKHD